MVGAVLTRLQAGWLVYHQLCFVPQEKFTALPRTPKEKSVSPPFFLAKSRKPKGFLAYYLQGLERDAQSAQNCQCLYILQHCQNIESLSEGPTKSESECTNLSGIIYHFLWSPAVSPVTKPGCSFHCKQRNCPSWC